MRLRRSATVRKSGYCCAPWWLDPRGIAARLVYAGVPASNTAFAVALRVLREEGVDTGRLDA